jgi:arsenate reductase
VGIDISAHRSKPLDEFLAQPVDTVITVCGNADRVCPVFPGQRNRHHWPFPDPSGAGGSREDVLDRFRAVRDEMRRAFEAYADGWRDASSAILPAGGVSGSPAK